MRIEVRFTVSRNRLPVMAKFYRDLGVDLKEINMGRNGQRHGPDIYEGSIPHSNVDVHIGWSVVRPTTNLSLLLTPDSEEAFAQLYDGLRIAANNLGTAQKPLPPFRETPHHLRGTIMALDPSRNILGVKWSPDKWKGDLK